MCVCVCASRGRPPPYITCWRSRRLLTSSLTVPPYLLPPQYSFIKQIFDLKGTVHPKNHYFGPTFGAIHPSLLLKNIKAIFLLPQVEFKDLCLLHFYDGKDPPERTRLKISKQKVALKTAVAQQIKNVLFQLESCWHTFFTLVRFFSQMCPKRIFLL